MNDGPADDAGITDEEFDACLPMLAQMLTEAAAATGDLPEGAALDADGLKKILAFAEGGRAHGGNDAPRVGPSPVSPQTKSLLRSPFAGRKAVVHGRDSRGWRRCYEDTTGHPVPCGPAKKPSAKQRRQQVPDWQSLKGKYRTPGAWLDDVFAGDETKKEAARQTPAYRRMVAAWEQDVASRWSAGDPRQAPPAPAKPEPPAGPGTPDWVDVPLSLQGEAADSHLAELLYDKYLRGPGEDFNDAFFEDEDRDEATHDDYIRSTVKAVKVMPRRARDLLADGLKEVAYVARKSLLADAATPDIARSVMASIDESPEWAAERFREMMRGRTIPPEYGQAVDLLKKLAEAPDLGARLADKAGAQWTKTRQVIGDFMIKAEWLKLQKASAHIGGIYDADVAKAYLNGPMSNGVIYWAAEAALGMDEGRYRISTADDAQTDVHAHELTHAIDRRRRFSGTPQWRAVWAEELGGDEGLAARIQAGKWPAKKYPLTVYAATEPSEGFAEVGRIVYGPGTDLKDFGRRFPRTAAFFKANGLWPDDQGGQNKDHPDVFAARLDFLGGHADLLTSAWKNIKDYVRGGPIR